MVSLSDDPQISGTAKRDVGTRKAPIHWKKTGLAVLTPHFSRPSSPDPSHVPPINLHLPNARTPTGRSSHGPRRQTPDTEGARGRAFHHHHHPNPNPPSHLRLTMGWRALKKQKRDHQFTGTVPGAVRGPGLADANTTSSVSGVLSESGGFAVGSLLGEHSLTKIV